MPKLTKKLVENITEEGWYRDTELKGFAIRARKAADGVVTKTYVINKRVRGTNQVVTVTIGKHGAVTCENARIEAQKILLSMAEGSNPNEIMQEEHKQAREDLQVKKKTEKLEAKTLQELLDDYLRTHDLKPKTRLDYERFTRRCLHDWLSMPITKITRDMVQERHIEISKDHPAQANVTMRVLRALFTYAIAVYEDDRGKPLLTVDRLRHARLWNKVQRRERVIRPDQLAAWYQAVMKVRSDARDVLLIEVFTGLRHSEAMGLRWEDVHFDNGTVMVRDTKNRTSFMLPMTTYLRHILNQRFDETGTGTFLFPGGGKSGHITDIRDSITAVITDSGIPFSEHDLRRTFETIAESLDISYYTLKKLLNHKTGNDPTAGYIITTAERLREAAQLVADKLAALMNMPEPKPDSKVVPHRRRKKA
jgi:integrase